MNRARQLAEKEAQDVVADEGSALARRYIRDTLKRNRASFFMYALAIIVPITFLSSFYLAKLRQVREKFIDPYSLPEGFDPRTGEFAAVHGGLAPSAGVAPKSMMQQSQLDVFRR